MISGKYFISNIYIAAVIGTAAILFILKELQFVFGGSPPLLFFLVVITFTAWHGGLKAGLFFTALATVASDYFLLEPYGSFYVGQASEILRIIFLITLGVISSLVITRLHNKEKQVLQQVIEREKQLKQEISVRKQAEATLYKSQQDLNHAQAVAHIGSWRIDVSNNALEWSDETFRIFDVPKDTPLTYQLFLDFVHPADRQLVDAAWTSALTGKPYDIKHRIIVGQNVKWVRERAELEVNEQGALLSGFGTAEDITDIKNSQKALRQERAFLRQVIDAVPSVISAILIMGKYSKSKGYNNNKPLTLMRLACDKDFIFYES
ncbi:DUF4118 domain-containing protein [Methylobacter psychrophilus]|uniref:DUF4118 domain-containing protein n=1 Tax=Methylobacter psychrophilus TaxID=96941 RepID=UPI0021D4ECCA|nr:DUF4118 domain-containing protein [Methylobacter psychrophilus]